jgi:hypothetical protein
VLGPTASSVPRALPVHSAGSFFPAAAPRKILRDGEISLRGTSRSVSVRNHPDPVFSVTCRNFNCTLVSVRKKADRMKIERSDRKCTSRHST